MSNKPTGVRRLLHIGDHAPDFTLPTHTGSAVSLKNFLGTSTIVLFFYPKDNSFGCTKEVCAFRDSYEVFKQAGVEVIGVSSDSLASHTMFAQKYQLPFMLASDISGEMRMHYGVPATFGFLPGRVTYIIDKQGIIRHIFSSQLTPNKHITEALTILKMLDTD